MTGDANRPAVHISGQNGVIRYILVKVRTVTGEIRPQSGYRSLLSDIVTLLEHASDIAVRSVNAVMTAEHWSVGHRIIEEEQGGSDRAAYGADTMEQLSFDLTRQIGRGSWGFTGLGCPNEYADCEEMP